MNTYKKYRNTILSELTRKQSDLLIDDIVDFGISTPKDIMQFRKSETYKKVFGNKQRIWLPLDIEIPIVEDLPSIINEYSYYTKMITDKLYVDIIIDMRTLIEKYTELFNKTVTDNMRLDSDVIIFMYINGYLKLDDKNPIKIGSLYAKVIDKIKKTSNNDDNTAVTLKKLTDGFARFNKRDTIIPREVYNAIKNIDDSVLYGTQIKNNKAYVCISRYPADVAAMSTGQGWTSCQNLDKGKTKTNIMYDELNWHVKYDIPLGTCVAYLISENNIQKSRKLQNVPNRYDVRFEHHKHIPKTSLFPLLSPTARVAIKPHYRTDDEDGASIYLSIGTVPIVYGDDKYEQILTKTVNEYLEDCQKDISGVFMIDDILYNEHIDGANIVVVKHGVIVDAEGDISTIEKDPSKLKNAKTIYSILYRVFQDYYKTVKFPTSLYCTDISNNTYSRNSLSIARCSLENCKFVDMDYIEISKTIDPLNLRKDAEKLFSNMSEVEFEKRYGKYGIKKNKLYRYFMLSEDDFASSFSNTRPNEDHLACIGCSFDNCNKMSVFNSCKFTDCEFNNCLMAFIFPIRENINRCKFDNCLFNVISSDNNTNVIKNCVFNNCSFNRFISIGNALTFANCEFNNTNMPVPKNFTIKYDNCTVDGKNI